MVFCRGCGKEIHESALTCPFCGAVQQTKSSNKRITAGVLAILLGGIGAHKFYLGQIGMGILYILFCWTFIPGIIGKIQGIIYLCQSDEDFVRKYG